MQTYPIPAHALDKAPQYAETAGSVPEPLSTVPDGANAAGYTSSLPDISSADSAVFSRAAADLKVQPGVYRERCQQPHAADQTVPGGAPCYRQALANHPMTPSKQKGRAGKGAGV